MGNYLLTKGTIVGFDPPAVSEEDLRIQDGTVKERGKGLSAQAGESVVSLSGKLILSGLVCAHTHLYSSLGRGMPPPKIAPRSFPEILQQVWWKLDRALDEESVYLSALIGAVEAVQCGTTVLIDHHASPSCITGSLSLIQQALQEVGVRGILCYEVTDRGGVKERDEGLEENERFLRECQAKRIDADQEDRAAVSGWGKRFWGGVVGAHASFTLSDDSLQRCAQMAREFSCGVHIHGAEDLCDLQDASQQHGKPLFERLLAAGLVGEGSIFAHGTHLEMTELESLQALGGWVIHNPRSNMNNAVGYARVRAFGQHAALGTDGIGADMFEEARIAYFKSQDARTPLSPSRVLQLLSGGHTLASRLLYLPPGSFGQLEMGNPADLIVLDYEPPTPLTKENLAGHFLFGISSRHVESVMVGGKWVVKQREFLSFGVKNKYEMARKAAESLWVRMENVKV